MNFLCKAQSYLNSIVSTVNSLAGVAISDEFHNNVNAQYKVIRTLIELEQNTSEFIKGMELDVELPNAIRISKQKFININKRLIKHLEEKIQFQGCHFEELVTTLKLENESLKKEILYL